MNAELLDEARSRAARRVSALGGALVEMVNAADAANLDDEHDPDGATVAFERAQLSALLRQAQEQLGEIDHALQRLRQGTYGVCERCGAPIPDARLAAQPATRSCVTCAGQVWTGARRGTP